MLYALNLYSDYMSIIPQKKKTKKKLVEMDSGDGCITMWYT